MSGREESVGGDLAVNDMTEAKVRPEAKSALITGASGGVGTAAVRRLAGMGWRVFAGVRTPEAAERISEASDQVVPVLLDVCDQLSIEQAVSSLAGQLGGGLDGLINNAGLSVQGPLELVPLEALRRQFEVNVIGQVAVTQAFLPMLRLAHGRVINMGGAAGRVTLPMSGGLSASKAALDSLSNTLRMELRYQGVKVSYVEPGGLQTDFFKKAEDAAGQCAHAGSNETQRIYANAIDASSRALAGSHATPVEEAVRAIVKALTVPRPSARYVVGWDARLVLPVLRSFPVRLRDRLVMSNLGLRREAFNMVSTKEEPPGD